MYRLHEELNLKRHEDSSDSDSDDEPDEHERELRAKQKQGLLCLQICPKPWAFHCSCTWSQTLPSCFATVSLMIMISMNRTAVLDL